MIAAEKKVDYIKLSERARKELGDIDALAESIRLNGQLQPIVIDTEDRLVCGFRRLQAMKKLGREYIAAVVVQDATDLKTALAMELTENSDRKDFTPTEKVELARRIEAALAEDTKPEKTKGEVRKGRGTVSIPVVKDEDVSLEPVKNERFGKAAREAAKIVGMNKTTLAKAKEVVEAAEEDPGFADIAEEMDSTGNVSGAHAKVKERKAKRESSKDAKGIEIPSSLRDTFGDSKWINEAIESCELMLRDLNSTGRQVTVKGQTIGWMSCSAIVKNLKTCSELITETKSMIESAKPYAVCPECDGVGKNMKVKTAPDCIDCRGEGYMPEWRYEELFTD